MGGEALYDVIPAEQLTGAYADKIDEENREFRESKQLEELVDIYEAVICAAVAIGGSEEELLSLAKEKRKQIGSFVSGHFVHTVTLPADSEIADYYASDPKRFPEVK